MKRDSKNAKWIRHGVISKESKDSILNLLKAEMTIYSMEISKYYNILNRKHAPDYDANFEVNKVVIAVSVP